MPLLARVHRARLNARSLTRMLTPFKASLDNAPVLEARGNRPLQMTDRKSTRLNSSHIPLSRMPSSA